MVHSMPWRRTPGLAEGCAPDLVWLRPACAEQALSLDHGGSGCLREGPHGEPVGWLDCKAPIGEEGFWVVTLNFMVTKVGSNAYSFGRALDRRRREGPRHLQMSVASRSSAEARGHFTITLTLMRVVSGLCHCLELRAAAPKALRRDPVCGSAGLEFVLRADEGHRGLSDIERSNPGAQTCCRDLNFKQCVNRHTETARQGRGGSRRCQASHVNPARSFSDHLNLSDLDSCWFTQSSGTMSCSAWLHARPVQNDHHFLISGSWAVKGSGGGAGAASSVSSVVSAALNRLGRDLRTLRAPERTRSRTSPAPLLMSPIRSPLRPSCGVERKVKERETMNMLWSRKGGRRERGSSRRGELDVKNYSNEHGIRTAAGREREEQGIGSNTEGSPLRAASFTWQPRVGNLVGYLGAVNARLPYGHRVGLGHDRHDRDVAADLVHKLEVRRADPESRETRDDRKAE